MSNEAEHLEAMLAEYVDGQLDPASARVVEEHLAANPATRAAVEQMKLDRAAVGALPRMNAPADLSEDLRGRLERDLLLNADPITATKTRRLSPPVAALAAMLMLGVGVASLAYVLLSDRPKPYMATNVDGPAARPETEGGEGASAATSESAPVAGRKLEDRDNALKRDNFAARKALPADESVAADATHANATESKDAAASNEATAMGGAATPADSATLNVDRTAPGTAAAASTAAPALAAHDAALGTTPVPDEPKLSIAAAPTPREPALAVTDASLPPDAAAALPIQTLDPSRRSLVVVVDSSHALDALAFASRFAGEGERALEVTEAGQQLTTRARKTASATAEAPPAELAVVARGLAEPAAIAFQNELNRVDERGARVFDVTPPAAAAAPISTPPQPAEATTQAAGLAGGDSARAMRPRADQPIERRALVASSAEAAGAAPTTAATTPTTRPAAPIGPALIRNGERLRVTLTDPDAFDLRTQHDVTVDAMGNIALPSLDALPAAGKSSETLRTAIVDAYRTANLMRRPIVKVESIDTGAASRDPSQLIDLYVVIRNRLPEVQPASQPATQPVVQSATRPATPATIPVTSLPAALR